MDEKTYVPSLTLNPTQAAAQEAPAAPQLVVEEEKPAKAAKPAKTETAEKTVKKTCASLPSRST